MRPLAPLLAIALGACTALPQGEHHARPDKCGAMDVMGVIGYPISEVHPYGMDRVIHVSESHGPTHAHPGYGHGKTRYGGGYDKGGAMAYGAPKGHHPKKGPIRVKPHRFTDVKTLWLGDPYNMNVYVNGHGIIVDVVCH